MRRTFLIVAGIVWSLTAGVALAQASAEKILPLDAHIAQDGRIIELNWFDAQPPRVGSVTVKRRLYGQTGGETWQTIAPALGPVMRYRDEEVQPGVAYEYQVLRTARDIVDVGYWLAGTEVPTQSSRGTAYLVVDETIAGPLASRLDRFARDLEGSGWRVRRHSVPRSNHKDWAATFRAARSLRYWLRAQYLDDPFGRHAIILVGHVPVVKSGRAAPDGHEPLPLLTDLIYADVDGRWSATHAGEVFENRVPGDFIEMQVGRIDFEPMSFGRSDAEIRFLRAYFDKNHHWRHGLLGDLRGAYGNYIHLDVEFAALRNIVGATAVVAGGHHDVGEQKPWLWGVDSGDSGGSLYPKKYANKAVFALNFGSHKQKVDQAGNAVTALLTQPWYPLAAGWGARPAWWLHLMALGGTIGDVHMRTVNNGVSSRPYRETMDYFPTGRYLWRNPVWVNLLGDPTLHAFPLAPPHALTMQRGADGVTLHWKESPDPAVLGYRLFRAVPGDPNGFRPVDGGQLIKKNNFLDSAPVDGAQYMLRAYGLKRVYAGSFYTYSQGIFATEVAAKAAPVRTITMTTPMAENLRLPEIFDTVIDGQIYAFIEGPKLGRLHHDGEGWVYTPPEKFTGTVTLRFSVSGQSSTEEGRLIVTVTGVQ